MAAGVQKNVRLSEQAADILRALKYDLDASDGEVVSRALEGMASQRLRHHQGVLKRVKIGLAARADATRSRAAIVPLLASSWNWQEERYRLEDDVLQAKVTFYPTGWVPASLTVPSGDAAVAVMDHAVDLVRTIPLPEMTPAVIILACCESPDAERFASLGVPVSDVAAHLREELQRRRTDDKSGEVPFSAGSKAVVMEASSGLALLDGSDTVEVEHLLVAALQSEHEDVVRVRSMLKLDVRYLRDLLWR